jgi:hypothetical protein
MSIENQIPTRTKESGRTITTVGQEAYALLTTAIAATTLENDLTGEREDELRIRDEVLGLDVHVHGNTTVKGQHTVPEIYVDDLLRGERLVIQKDGTLIIDGRIIIDFTKAEERAAFVRFIVSLTKGD